MGSCHIILSIGIALLFGVDTLSTGVVAEAVSTSPGLTHSIVSGASIVQKRSLRINTRVETGEGDLGTYEERAWSIVSKLSSLFDTFSKPERNVVRWADAQKSDDFVLKKLNLKGLAGDALTEHKNYKFFEQFVRIKNWNQRNWLSKETPTSVVWKTLGLGKIKTLSDLDKAIDTEAFQVYQRYAKSVDDNAIVNVYKEIKPVSVISDASWTEKIARILSWKTNKQSEVYVMMALGFDKLSVSAIKKQRNDQIFMVFWFLKNKNSLEAAKQNTEISLIRLLKLDRLSPEELTKSDKYQVYKYLSDLIKKDDFDKQVPTLVKWLDREH